MADKIFGVTNAAGTQVRVRDVIFPVTTSPFGWIGVVGTFKRGPVQKDGNDVAMKVINDGDLENKTGGYLEGSVTPDFCRDFFKLSGGAGGILASRVTNGEELAAEATIYARRKALTAVGKIKAHNGGRWGAAEVYFSDDRTALTETTIDTPLTLKVDELKGGFLELEDVPNTTYEIVGNDAAGVITVAADSTMLTDYTDAGGSTNRFHAWLESPAGEELTYQISYDADQSLRFHLDVYLDGNLVQQWTDLDWDPADTRYWVDVINDSEDETGNYYIEVEDTWTGARTADSRPCNYYNTYTGLTATTLTLDLTETIIVSPGGGDATFTPTYTADTLPDTLTLTFTTATDFDVVSARFGALGSSSLGSTFIPARKWVPNIVSAAGGSPHAASDVVTLHLKPIVPDALVGGFIYPDIENDERLRYRVVSNTQSVITVAPGSDMVTDVTGGATEVLVSFANGDLEGGRDGNILTDPDYAKYWDVGNSPFNDFREENLGLIKFATPGVTATQVQKDMAAYVLNKGYMARYEIPDTTVKETGIEAFVIDTLAGRVDGTSAHAPSQVYVQDPEASSKQKLVSVNGMILGLEAKQAAAVEGYFDPAAGINFALPDIVRTPLGNKKLDEEYLSPLGFNFVVKRGGRFVNWGNDTMSSVPANKQKSVYEQIYYWVHFLRENFMQYIFRPNNRSTRNALRTQLITYFQGEYNKGALDNTVSFDESFVLKLDSDNNTDVTKAAGDLVVDITVKPTFAIKRLVFSIGQKGISVSEE